MVFLRIRKEEARSYEYAYKYEPVNPVEHKNETFQFDEYTPDIWSTEIYMLIYGGMIISLCVITLLRSILFYRVCARASQNLHDRMFRGLVGTTMTFFHLNPSGRIMNRISSDLGSIDEALPKSFFTATQVFVQMLGSISITILFSNSKFAIIVLVMSAIIIWARKYYLISSKNLRRLQGSSMCLIVSFDVVMYFMPLYLIYFHAQQQNHRCLVICRLP